MSDCDWCTLTPRWDGGECGGRRVLLAGAAGGIRAGGPGTRLAALLVCDSLEGIGERNNILQQVLEAEHLEEKKKSPRK